MTEPTSLPRRDGGDPELQPASEPLWERACSLPQGLAVNPLPNYQKRCWVRRLHQLSNTRSTEPLAAMPMRSCRLLRSA